MRVKQCDSESYLVRVMSEQADRLACRYADGRERGRQTGG